MRFPKTIAPLFLLAFGGSAFVLSAAAPSPNSPNSFNSLSSWILPDFDGDNHSDTATASASHPDAHGYAQEIRLDLSTALHSIFRSRTANVELNSWDIDGDHDRDLIIFEPLSKIPIGIWLNDGAGTFHRGNLDDFKHQLDSRKTASDFRAVDQPIGLVAVGTPNPAILIPLPLIRGSSKDF